MSDSLAEGVTPPAGVCQRQPSLPKLVFPFESTCPMQTHISQGPPHLLPPENVYSQFFQEAQVAEEAGLKFCEVVHAEVSAGTHTGQGAGSCLQGLPALSSSSPHSGQGKGSGLPSDPSLPHPSQIHPGLTTAADPEGWAKPGLQGHLPVLSLQSPHVRTAEPAVGSSIPQSHSLGALCHLLPVCSPPRSPSTFSHRLSGLSSAHPTGYPHSRLARHDDP